MDGWVGFDWDASNVAHIMRHNVTPFEVEEVAEAPHIRFAAKQVGSEVRWEL